MGLWGAPNGQVSFAYFPQFFSFREGKRKRWGQFGKGRGECGFLLLLGVEQEGKGRVENERKFSPLFFGNLWRQRELFSSVLPHPPPHQHVPPPPHFFLDAQRYAQRQDMRNCEEKEGGGEMAVRKSGSSQSKC